MNIKHFNLLLFSTLSILISSCSSTNLMSLNTTQPSSVFFKAKDCAVGIIDRSLPSEKNETFDAIDKILSAEGKNLDKDGAYKLTIGIQEELSKNNQIKEVKIIESGDFRSNGLSIFPTPIAWNKIEQVCAKNKVDILFELSYYDTDSKIEFKTFQTESKDLFGLKIPLIQTQATINTLIKTGWRIYDLKNKMILDEFSINDNIVLSGRGVNPMRAIEAIMSRKEAVLQVSSKIGRNYALRIVPYTIRVSRDYFVKGNGNFVIAKRRAQTGNWDGAAELWEKETRNKNPKISGRACYNMAIINEINGNLEAAVDWASKSYSDYNNKLALHYLNVLKNRINKNKVLTSQLN